MKLHLQRVVLFAAFALGGCAMAPSEAPAPASAPPVMDGGIVGTGNRPECETPECRRDAR